MVRAIAGALDEFESNAEIGMVLLTGEGERGLCAGGDVKLIHEQGIPLAATFWRDEFRLNSRIARYSKPYIAIMDGITMGSGVGLSAHGRYRIVTERTRLAMPETAIGYFPDVGSNWLLAKASGEAGTYIALTGKEIDSADCIFAGLADFQVDSGDLPSLIEELGSWSGHSEVLLVDLFSSFARQPPSSSLQSHLGIVNQAFAGDSVEVILARLADQQDGFSREALRVMRTRSPTSLKLALRLIRLARDSASLEECLEREYAAGLRLLEGPDFYEGVRAVLIDKDNKPQWRPARLEEITDQQVEGYLNPLAAGSPAQAREPLFPVK